MDKSILSLISIGASFGWIIIGGSIMILNNYPLIDQVRFVYTPSIIVVLVGVILHVINMSKQRKLTEVNH